MLFIFHNVIGYSSSILPLYWYLSGISQVVWHFPNESLFRRRIF